MTKKKINLEYSLNAVSGPILWNAIGTATGLQTWMADKVDVNENIYTFEWSQSEVKEAELTHHRTNSHVRFHWLDDEDAKSFFELRMEYNELTGDYTLLITDFAEEDEVEDLMELWNTEVNQLIRLCGM